MLTPAKQTENQTAKPASKTGSFFGSGSSTPFFQPKLTVNQPGDIHEQEADRVADQVMRMKEGDAPLGQQTPSPGSGVMRICTECEKEGLPRKETGSGDAGRKVAPPMVSKVLSSGGGQPMESGARRFMESRFGQDFSPVRIHTDSRAAESANAIQARAYTSGTDIVFGAGQYQPSTSPGQRLLAHELAHVRQQGGEHNVNNENIHRSGCDNGCESKPDTAPDAEPVKDTAPKPGPSKDDPVTAKAKADALTILSYIKSEAQKRAKIPRVVDVNSKFYKRLVDFYLKDYLKNPNATAGKEATQNKIGKPFLGPATAGDDWEKSALSTWNKQPIPASIRAMRPKLKPQIEAGTDILSVPNRAKLPYIDVPHLLGGLNKGTTFDADWAGGKNISQLMHWATGVKNADTDKQTMRELFLGYEMWHLEQWDVFGQDPINDLIAEEAGRIMGTQLQQGVITSINLQSKLSEGFSESRAWVGSLLRARQKQLDEWILAETQPKANMWWGTQPGWDIYAWPWKHETITSRLKLGKTIDEVKKWSLTEQIIEIYTLIYEATEWEAVHGKIVNGPLIDSMLSGALDGIFKTMVKEEADAAKAAAPAK